VKIISRNNQKAWSRKWKISAYFTET